MASLTRHESRQAAFQILFALEKDPQDSKIDDLYDIVLNGKTFDDFTKAVIFLGVWTRLESHTIKYFQ